MEVAGIVSIEIWKDRANLVTVSPVVGLRFGLNLPAGTELPKPGLYRIQGVLRKVNYPAKADRPAGEFWSVTPTALVPAQLAVAGSK